MFARDAASAFLIALHAHDGERHPIQGMDRRRPRHTFTRQFFTWCGLMGVSVPGPQPSPETPGARRADARSHRSRRASVRAARARRPGAGDFKDPYRNVIVIFMNQIMQEKPMTLFNDDSQERVLSSVGDVAPFTAGSPWVRAAHNEVINIGADVPFTAKVFLHEMAAAMGAGYIRHSKTSWALRWIATCLRAGSRSGRRDSIRGWNRRAEANQ